MQAWADKDREADATLSASRPTMHKSAPDSTSLVAQVYPMDFGSVAPTTRHLVPDRLVDVADADMIPFAFATIELAGSLGGRVVDVGRKKDRGGTRAEGG